MAKGPKPRTAAEKFHDKYAVDPDTGCWNWTDVPGDHGYGTISEAPAPMQRRTLLAHRVSYELHKGPIPDGLVVDHMCNNRRCVNPDHLQAITHEANIKRSPAPHVQRWLTGRCIRGHDLTDPEVAYIRPDNGRPMCRVCVRIRGEATRRNEGKMPQKRGRECGTYSGAIGHYQRGEQPCDPCKAAQAQYRRDYAARKKAG